MAKRKARGHGKDDPRKGRKQNHTQSKYSGNNDKCPTCDMTYGYFKTGLTYFEVWMMFWVPELEQATKNKTRGVILGKWFAIKQEEWARHMEQCEEQSEYQTREDIERIDLNDSDMSDVPF